MLYITGHGTRLWGIKEGNYIHKYRHKAPAVEYGDGDKLFFSLLRPKLRDDHHTRI